jgi:hemerythrin-like metal-binding protein
LDTNSITMASNQTQSLIDQDHNPSLATRVNRADAENRDLIALFDVLVHNPDAAPHSEFFSEILSQLGQQIGAHFVNEESILMDLNMPAAVIESHVRAHNEILAQYTALNHDLMHGKPLDRTDVLLMIKRWLVDHVEHHDMGSEILRR